ncbi:MAG TPA: hypothetical protein P5511_04855 [Candidatus Goldiibacteriota bacterium]|nr:hypothetical protein [Candidatus Goldiibacteriota bacterium]
MKKVLVMALAAVFAIGSVAAFAGPNCMEKAAKKCGMAAKDGKCCAMCAIDADVKVTETKDGVTITISAKEGGADAKAIQEAAKNCCCIGKNKKDK